MKQALPPLSARSLWANPRAAFPVHLTGAFRCGFHMDAIAVSQELTPIRNDRNAVRPQVDENRLHTMSDKAPGLRRLPGSTTVHPGVEELCDLSPCSAQPVGSSNDSKQRLTQN